MALSSAHTISLRDALEVVPYYDGSNIPFTHFSRGCNEAKTMLPPEAEINLVKLIRTRLLGEPRRTIEYLTFDKLSELLSYLRRIFGNSKSYYQLQGELERIYQKKTESVITYATRIKNLGREMQETYESTHNSDMNNLTKISMEKEMIRCFTNGLLPEIEQRMRDYENIDEAIQKAINIETRLETISSIKCRNEVHDSYSQEELLLENCQICSNLGHSAINCSYRYQNPLENSRGNVKFNIITCQICNKRGHLASECRLSKYRKIEERPVRYIRKNLSCQMCNSYGHTAEKCLQSQRLRTFAGIERETCQLCHQHGHTADRCYKSQPLSSSQIFKTPEYSAGKCYKIRSHNSSENQSMCQLCKQIGHSAEICSRRSQILVRSSEETLKCKYCKEFGHVIGNCIRKERAEQRKLEQRGRIDCQTRSSNKNYTVSTKIINNNLQRETEEENVVRCDNVMTKERLLKTNILNIDNENRSIVPEELPTISAMFEKNREILNTIQNEYGIPQIINLDKEEDVVKRDSIVTEGSLLEIKTLDIDDENRFNVTRKSLTTVGNSERNREILNNIQNEHRISQMMELNKEENVESDEKLKVMSQGFVEEDVDLNLKFEGKGNSSTQSEHPETPFVIRDDMYLHPGIQIHESSNQSGYPETSVHLGDAMKSHQNVQNRGVLKIEIKENYINLREEIYDQDDSQENRSPSYNGNINEREDEIINKSDSLLLMEKSKDNSIPQREFLERDKINIEANENNINSRCIVSRQNMIQNKRNYCSNFEKISKIQGEILNKFDSMLLLENFIDIENNFNKIHNKSSPHVRFKDKDKNNVESNKGFIKLHKEIGVQNHVQSNYYVLSG